MHKGLGRGREIQFDPLGRTVDLTENTAAFVAAAHVNPLDSSSVHIWLLDARLLKQRASLWGHKSTRVCMHSQLCHQWQCRRVQ